MNKKLIQRMHEIINFYVQNKEFMGTVLVAQDDDIFLHQGYGLANLEWDIPNDIKTRFRIGSLTKQFTAVGILLLEERGLLNTEDLITKHLSNVPNTWKKIKLFHLLNHTHGIPNYTELAEFQSITTCKKTPWEQIQLFIGKPLDFEPGTKYYYNNTGYVLLGYLIEQLTGQAYASFIKDNIFKPLHMNDSGYDSFTEIIPCRASGYSKDINDVCTNAEYLDMSLPYAAGSLYSTVSDLWKWTQGIFNCKLLTADSIKKMTTPFKEHYGFGVEVKKIDGENIIMHVGGSSGFNTTLMYLPRIKTTIAVLSNLNTPGYVWGVGFVSQNIALKLSSVVLNKAIKLPSEKKQRLIPSEILVQYIGEYALNPNSKIMISLNNERLEVAFPHRPIISLLFAETELDFYSIFPDIEVKFIKDKSNHVNKIRILQGGYEITAHKI